MSLGNFLFCLKLLTVNFIILFHFVYFYFPIFQFFTFRSFALTIDNNVMRCVHSSCSGRSINDY